MDRRLLEAIGLAFVASSFGVLALVIVLASGG